MFLSKVIVNSRDRETIVHLDDANFWHKRVMSGFENLNETNNPRQEMGILFRKVVRGSNIVLFVQSKVEPNWYGKVWILGAEIKDLNNVCSALVEGKSINFDMLSVPYYTDNSESKRGRARCFKTEEDKINWFTIKGEYNGFVVENISIIKDGEYLNNVGGNKKTLYLTHFIGSLRITDADKFKTFYMNGTGKQKSYGAGMLLLS